MEDSETMGSVTQLIEELLKSSSPHEKELTIAHLLRLAKSGKDARVLIGSHSQAMPLLLSILREGSPGAKTNVAATFSVLSKDEDIRMKILLGGCVPPLLPLLRSEFNNLRKAAAEAIYEISNGGLANDHLGIKTVVTEDVVPALWEHLSLKDKQDEVVEGYVAGALRNLCGDGDGYWGETFSATRVDTILGLLLSENAASRSNAASLLAHIMPAIKGSLKKVLDSGTVETLLRLVGQEDELSVRSNASHALEALSLHSTESVKKIVDAGGIPVLIGAAATPPKDCIHEGYGQDLQGHSICVLTSICGGLSSLIVYLGELVCSPRNASPVADVIGALAYCLKAFHQKSFLKEKPFNVKQVERSLVMLLKTRENKVVQDCVFEALTNLYGNNLLSRWLIHGEAKKILIELVNLAFPQVQEHLVDSLCSLCTDEAGLWVALKKKAGVQLLTSFLGSSNDQNQELSVQLLAVMADEVDDGKWATAAAEGIPSLVMMLETGSQKTREDAGRVLSKLCYCSADVCASVESAGAVPAFLCLLRSGGPKGQEVSAKALRKLVQNADPVIINQLREMLTGDFPTSKAHIIPVLGHLLTLAPRGDLAQRGAAANTSLYALVKVLNDSVEETQELVASVLVDLFNARQDIYTSLATDEIIQPCIRFLISKKRNVASNFRDRALNALSRQNSPRSSQNISFVARREVKPLIKLAKISFLHAAEASVAALANLVSDSEIAGEALDEDVLPALTRVLREGTPEGKKNASRALSLLLKHYPEGDLLKENSQFRVVVLLLLESLKSLDLEDTGALDVLGIVSLLSRRMEKSNLTYPLWSTFVEVPSSMEPLVHCLAEGPSLLQDKSIEILSRLCGAQPVELANMLIARSKSVLSLAARVMKSSSLEVRIGAAAILICAAREGKQQAIVLLDLSGCVRPLICALLLMAKENSNFRSLEIEVQTPRASKTAFHEPDELKIPDPTTVLGGNVFLWLLSIISCLGTKYKHIIMEAGVMEVLSEKLMNYTSDRQSEIEDDECAWIGAMHLAMLFQDESVVDCPPTMRIIQLLTLLLKSNEMIDKLFAAQALASLVCNGKKAVLLTIANSGAIPGLIAFIGCVDPDAPNLVALCKEFSLYRNPDQVVLKRLFEIDDVRIGLISRKAIPLLVDLLRPMPDRPHAPAAAVNLLIQIADGCDANKLLMAEAGVLEALPKYLSLCHQESMEASILELLRILFRNADVVRHKAAPNSLNQLIAVLRFGSGLARQTAAQALCSLFEVDYIRDSELAYQAFRPLANMIYGTSEGEQEAALSALLKLTPGISLKVDLLVDLEGNIMDRVYKILSFTSSMELQKTAAEFCFIMFNNPRIRLSPVATKCMQPLILLMESHNDSVVESTVCAFEKLLDDEEQVQHALGHDVVALLVGLISRSNYRLAEASIKALIKLGKDRTPRKLDMVKAGVISNCLAILPAAPSSLCSTILEFFRILTNSGAIARSRLALRIVEPLFIVLLRPDLSMWAQHTTLQALVNILEKPLNMTTLELNPSQVLEPLIPFLESPLQPIQQLSTELLYHLVTQNRVQQDVTTKKAIAPLVQLIGIDILTLQQTAVSALEKISVSWPKELTDAGIIFELSKLIMKDDPKPPHSPLWESAALILTNILHVDYYFEVPLVVLVSLLHSSYEGTVNTALNALIFRERYDAHSVESMAEAHAIETLLDLLRSHQCEEAAGRLLEALFNNARVREMMVAKYAIAPLSQYLLDPQTTSQSGRLLAALALGDLSQHEGLARSADAISACRALIHLLRDQPTMEMKMVGLCALQNFLIQSQMNRRAVADAGGIVAIQEQLLCSNLEVAAQASLLIRFLFSDHTLQEYMSNELVSALSAALERQLWSQKNTIEEVTRTIHVVFTKFPKPRASDAATLCIPHLVGALKSGSEAAQESSLDTLCFLKHSWSTMPLNIAKSQEVAAAEAIPALQMLRTTPIFHERADSLLSCLPGCLTVTIHRGSSFKQSMSYTSVYCQLAIGNHPPRQTKFTRLSTSPEWEEAFTWAFDVPPKGDSVYIVCKSKSAFGKTTLGRVAIGVDSAVDEGSYRGLFMLTYNNKIGSKSLDVELNWSSSQFSKGMQKYVGWSAK